MGHLPCEARAEPSTGRLGIKQSLGEWRDRRFCGFKDCWSFYILSISYYIFGVILWPGDKFGEGVFRLPSRGNPVSSFRLFRVFFACGLASRSLFNVCFIPYQMLLALIWHKVVVFV